MKMKHKMHAASSLHCTWRGAWGDRGEWVSAVCVIEGRRPALCAGAGWPLPKRMTCCMQPIPTSPLGSRVLLGEHAPMHAIGIVRAVMQPCGAHAARESTLHAMRPCGRRGNAMLPCSWYRQGGQAVWICHAAMQAKLKPFRDPSFRLTLDCSLLPLAPFLPSARKHDSRRHAGAGGGGMQ